MKTKLLIPSVLVAAGMLAAPFVHAQSGQMPGQPGQTAPTGPRPMPAPGEQGSSPSTATPMPPATGGGASSHRQRPGGPGMHHQQQRSQGAMPPGAMSGQSPGAPMGAQSPYAPQKWNKGDKLPAEFRDRQYVIDNYKQYDLPAPRKGYHWVGIGADYYQVSGNGTIYSVGPQ